MDLNKQCKMSVRRDKQEWAEKKAAQGEAELASGRMKDAFAHFRSLKSTCPRIVSPILDTNDKLVSDKSAKSKRWKENFEQLLNHPPVTVPNLPAGPREDDVQLCSVPSLAEVSAAVKRLRNGKASGLCGISAEMLKPAATLECSG